MNSEQKILVKRSGAYGDVLLATTILPCLRKKYPLALIDFYTLRPELLEGNPYIHNIVNKVGDYDHIYELDDSYENYPELSILDAYAKVAGCRPEELKLELKIPDKYVKAANELLSQKGIGADGKIIAIQSATNYWVKNWFINGFEAVVAKIKEKYGVTVLLLGSRRDPVVRGAVDFRGLGNIMLSAAILKRCRAFIGLDTSFIHFSKALDIPVAGLFGATDPAHIIRPSEKDLIIVSDIDCRFCHHRQPPPAHITICEKDNKLFQWLDLIFEKKIAQMKRGWLRNLVIILFKLLFYWRQKGRVIAPCMQRIKPKDVFVRISTWLEKILK